MAGPRAPKTPTGRCEPDTAGRLETVSCRGQDGYQAAIAQDERQVRRGIVVRSLKNFIAREDFAHQRLAVVQAGNLAQFIGKLLEERGILGGGYAGRGSVAHHDINSVAGGGGGEGFGLVPIHQPGVFGDLSDSQQSALGVVGLAGFGPSQVSVPFEPGIDMQHIVGGAETVVGGDHDGGFRSGQLAHLLQQIIHAAEIVEAQTRGCGTPNLR